MFERVAVGRWIVLAALVAAVAALLLLLLSGPGTRFGWWHFRTGLGLFRWVVYGGGAAVVLGAIALFMGGRRGLAVAALLIGLACAAVPLAMRRQATSVPMIHDITTDTHDPPAFEALLAARAGAMNPPEYAGREVAEQQQRAYPDITTLVLADSPAPVFERALAAARELGWDIASARSDAGRLEATDTTPWFGFKDDVVVRVRPCSQRTCVDVRSKSRVGRSDLGTNAKRIRRFVAKLRSRAPSAGSLSDDGDRAPRAAPGASPSPRR